MDDLIIFGVLAVAIAYLVIVGFAIGVIYGLYLLITAITMGDFTFLLKILVFGGLIGFAYGCIGIILSKIGVI